MQTRVRICTFLGLLAFSGCAFVDRYNLSEIPNSDTVQAQSISPPKRPSKYWMRVSQYAICSDTELNPNDPFFRDLEQLPGQLQDCFRLPAGNGIVQVFLFETPEQYDAYMVLRYPKLPSRRAYFIAEPRAGSTGDDLLVFTWMGEHLKTDLRHELTHAILHGVLKGVPLWLDEGIASYFELPHSANGVNGQHLDQLTTTSFQPDLARLESLSKVAQMEKPEYREAWAWVHFLLHSSPKSREILIAYMLDLQTNSNPPPLLPKLRELNPEPNGELLQHLISLSQTRQPSGSKRQEK